MTAPKFPSWAWLVGILLPVVGYFLVTTLGRVGDLEASDRRQDTAITRVQTLIEPIKDDVKEIKADVKILDVKIDRLLERR